MNAKQPSLKENGSNSSTPLFPHQAANSNAFVPNLGESGFNFDPVQCHWQSPDQQCQMSAATYGELSQHVLHDHIEPQTAIVCEWDHCENLVASQQLTNHVWRDHHPDQYVCLWQTCGITFSDSNQLERHMEVAHVGALAPLGCHWTGCSATTATTKELQSHVNNEHLHIGGLAFPRRELPPNPMQASALSPYTAQYPSSSGCQVPPPQGSLLLSCGRQSPPFQNSPSLPHGGLIPAQSAPSSQYSSQRPTSQKSPSLPYGGQLPFSPASLPSPYEPQLHSSYDHQSHAFRTSAPSPLLAQDGSPYSSQPHGSQSFVLDPPSMNQTFSLSSASVAQDFYRPTSAPQTIDPQVNVSESFETPANVSQSFNHPTNVPQGFNPFTNVTQGLYPLTNLPQLSAPQANVPQSFDQSANVPQDFNSPMNVPRGFDPPTNVYQSFYPHTSEPQNSHLQANVPESFDPLTDLLPGFNPPTNIPQSSDPQKDVPQGFNLPTNVLPGFNQALDDVPRSFNPPMSVPQSFNHSTNEYHVCKWKADEGRICGASLPSENTLQAHVEANHYPFCSRDGLNLSAWICNWENCKSGTKPKGSKTRLIKHMYIHTLCMSFPLIPGLSYDH